MINLLFGDTTKSVGSKSVIPNCSLTVSTSAIKGLILKHLSLELVVIASRSTPFGAKVILRIVSPVRSMYHLKPKFVVSQTVIMLALELILAR